MDLFLGARLTFTMLLINFDTNAIFKHDLSGNLKYFFYIVGTSLEREKEKM